ncbi:DUF1559 domain-containing protein [bacterium]|nr:DUF1559 domain-containing protein [bacterium]
MSNDSDRRMTGEFQAVDLLVAICIVGLLIGVTLPALQRAHGPARRAQCQNNLKQLGLAMTLYATCHNSLPSCSQGVANRQSGLIVILPELEQENLYNQIVGRLNTATMTYPAMGPAPWIKGYPPWFQQLELLDCPSDPNVGDKPSTSYAFCVGDVARIYDKRTTPRGAFAPGQNLQLARFRDGLSNTIMMGEISYGRLAINQPARYLDNPGLCRKNAFNSLSLSIPRTRGYRWADGGAGPAMFNTILPPNSSSCAVGGSDGVNGLYSLASYHSDCAQVVFCDGSVLAIHEDIDTGNLSKPPIAPGASGESPYGVWGALGTTSSGEDVTDY